jgi:autotransporter translocation and assembly factor TamB
MRSNFWRIGFGILIALVAPIAVVLILAILVLWVPPVGRYALSQALVRVGPRIGMSVRFAHIEGNIMRRIELDDLVLKLGPDSLKVKSVSLSYDPITSVLRRTFSASSATAVEPRVYISSRRPSTARSGAVSTRYPPIRVGQLRLYGGSVFIDTTERADSIDLTLNLVSESHELQARLTDVRARLKDERVTVREVRGDARLTPDSLAVTDLLVRTAASVLRADVRMAFSPNAIAARIESLSVGLPEFTPFKGRLRASGDVGLARDEPSGDVEYSAAGLVWQGIDLPTITGSLTLNDSVVQATMSGSDTTLGSADVAGRLDLRKLDFSGTARLTGLRLRRVQPVLPAARADIELAAGGRGLDSVAASVTARSPDLGIDSLSLSGSYVGRSQLARLDQLDLSGALGVVSGSGSWRKGRLQAAVRMERLDLGMLSRIESLSVKGRVSGSIDFAGTADTLAATADLSVTDLQAAGFSAARSRAELTVTVGRALSGAVTAVVDQGSYRGVAADSVRLAWSEQRFNLALWRPGVDVSAGGSARLARAALDLEVDTLRVRTARDSFVFPNALQLGLTSESLGVRVAAAGLASGDVRAAFASAAGRPPRIEATVSRVDLARVKALLGFGLEMSGVASINVSGTDSLDVAIDAERVRIPDFDVDLSRVQGLARVNPTRVDFDHLWLVHKDSMAAPETSSVTGWFEYSTTGGFVPGATDLRARLRNPGAWVVFYLKDILELQQGTIYGDVAVGGGLTRPVFKGRVRISRARLGVPILGTAFDRVNAELVFDRSRINIEKLSGRSEHGNALVTGFVDVGGNWQVDSLRFHGDFSGTTVNPVPELYGTIGGSLDVNWTLGRPFAVSGTVNVEEALISFGFGQSAGGGGGSPDTMLTYDVRVRADRNIWFRNQLADIELACDLNVRKTTRDVFYSGELNSRRGSIYYLDHTLRIDSGQVRFDNISTLNPEFYITAFMPLRTATQEGVPDTIVVAITGTLEKPSLTFRSIPPTWDESQIISYLTLNVTPGQLEPGSQKSLFSSLLSDRLLSYFQTEVSKRARSFVNLDYLSFESGWLTGQDTKVTVGKYIGRNLYVSYTQSFTSITPSFRVEYYVNRKNEILAEGTGATTPGEEYRTSLRYQFKLRY